MSGTIIITAVHNGTYTHMLHTRLRNLKTKSIPFLVTKKKLQVHVYIYIHYAKLQTSQYAYNILNR